MYFKENLHKHGEELSKNNRSGSGKANYHNESIHLKIKGEIVAEKKILKSGGENLLWIAWNFFTKTSENEKFQKSFKRRYPHFFFLSHPKSFLIVISI